MQEMVIRQWKKRIIEKVNYRKGELYITKIIDEELKADDLCI